MLFCGALSAPFVGCSPNGESVGKTSSRSIYLQETGTQVRILTPMYQSKWIVTGITTSSWTTVAFIGANQSWTLRHFPDGKTHVMCEVVIGGTNVVRIDEDGDGIWEHNFITSAGVNPKNDEGGLDGVNP
jgi:hypothetical protein